MFLHDALVEGLTEGNSNVTAAEFPEYYERLNHLNPATQKSGILEQFQVELKYSEYLLSINGINLWFYKTCIMLTANFRTYVNIIEDYYFF